MNNTKMCVLKEIYEIKIRISLKHQFNQVIVVLKEF